MGYKITRKMLLSITFVLLLVLPLGGSLIKWKGLPPGLQEGAFARLVCEKPGFNPVIFTIFAVLGIVTIILFFFPQVAGFKVKKYSPSHKIKRTFGFPPWFWIGMFVCACTGFILAVNVPVLTAYTFLPFWWGFIFIIDGIVYKRKEGISLVSTRFSKLIISGAVSTGIWYLFEYLNFFILTNWWYPNKGAVPGYIFVIWHLLSFSVIIPLYFEIYSLLKTFNILNTYYANGPKWRLPKEGKTTVFLIGITFMVLMAAFPNIMFFSIWLGPLFLCAGALALLGIDTPFHSISRGDWTPFVLMSLASFVTGFLWELWNYISIVVNPAAPANLNLWLYDLPYVDRVFIFSEMPILGYLGYLPFGLVCWVMWNNAAHILGVCPKMELDD